MKNPTAAVDTATTAALRADLDALTARLAEIDGLLSDMVRAQEILGRAARAKLTARQARPNLRMVRGTARRRTAGRGQLHLVGGTR
ncbi:MAG TPA: hypothetical protein VJT49_14950 [Amycolatopsis sp.]|uniref:hypothetical protein n=1 Tax=Amycolatopsis sp. TaxID=37632 RepID=UPI002B4A6073|nr:hypothetical protein [Amycolatopsis sp.]HKS46377.1 hypothetical protein [Amycolatopsis sp.]